MLIPSENSQIDKINLLVSDLQFPEGPAFGLDGSLWAVELKGQSLISFKNGNLKRYHVGGSPNGIAIDKQGSVWFCDAEENAIRRFNTHKQLTETIINKVDGQELNKPNDLAFDAVGNLVFTCPGNSRQNPSGYACVLKPDGTVKKITTGKYFPNGLAFSEDGKTLVIAETYQHRLWKGEWNAKRCEWENAKVWCEIGGPEGPGGPDGMAFVENGDLYVAVYGTSSVRVVSSDGKVKEQVIIEGKCPTNCAFDPTGNLGLVITEAEKGQIVSISSMYRGVILSSNPILYQ
jgi:gluconolactonase